MKMRALIVDDEPLAREKIRTLLQDDPAIEIVGECGDGRTAASAIVENDPDIVFLDVQMPEMDGFAALESIDGDRLPVIVFVTAYDKYALKAFEVHAIDYLLKPFDRRRFKTALDHAKKRVGTDRGDAAGERVVGLLNELIDSRRQRVERLVVRARGQIFFVAVEDIDWIEAAGNYVELHIGSDTHLIRATMKGIEERIDPGSFVRVHRSAIVNIDRIKQIEPWSGGGEYVITLKSGATVTSGGSYREALKSLMENPR